MRNPKEAIRQILLAIADLDSPDMSEECVRHHLQDALKQLGHEEGK